MTNEKTSGRIENFLQQNSPINNELIRNEEMNDILHTNTDGHESIIPTEVITRTRSKKASQVITICSFAYGNDVNQSIFSLKSANTISAYDLRIYNAICTLYLYGINPISLNEIYAVMTGYKKNNPNTSQTSAIERCLEKLSSLNVSIDITDEFKANLIQDKQPLIDAGILKNNKDTIKKVTIEGKMITYIRSTTESEAGKKYRCYTITTGPALLTYNRAKKTLIAIPMEYIVLNNNKTTERLIAFQDYLLIRIMGYKNGKMRENKILYSTIYRDSGVDVPGDKSNRKRDRLAIKNMMNEWIAAGLLESFRETKKGKTIDGIEFEIGSISPKQRAG